MHDVIDVFLKLPIALGSNADDDGVARLDLLDVGERLLVDVALRCECDHRNALDDQRERAVLQLARRICLGVDVGNLLELQRTLKRDGIVQTAPDVKDILVEAVLLRKGLDRIDIGQDLRDLRGNLLQLCNELCRALRRNRPLDLRHVEREHEEEDELCRIRLRRGDRNLRASPRIDDLICLARDGRANHVRDGKGLCPAPL